MHNFRIRLINAILFAGLASWAYAEAPYVGVALYPLTPPVGIGDPFLYATPQYAFGNQMVGYGTLNGQTQGFLWNGSAASAVELTPANIGITSAVITSTNGVEQGGTGDGYALLWSGTAASTVVLNSVGYTSAGVNGLGGGQQVGSAIPLGGSAFDSHAMLWTGSASSAVDLNPTHLAGVETSVADATDGVNQVGSTGVAEGGRALLWSGTADSAIDLTPQPGNPDAAALGVYGNQQVGYIDSAYACLWNGTPDSVVELAPAGIFFSKAIGTNGSEQVGSGYGPSTGNSTHALLWSGSAASMVDLENLLPADGTWQYSYAYSIDSNGVISGSTFGTYDGVTGTFAVEWMPVPEPVSIGVFLEAGFLLLRRRGLHLKR